MQRSISRSAPRMIRCCGKNGAFSHQQPGQVLPTSIIGLKLLRSIMATNPIKADELAALCAATSVCCADASAAFVAKKRAATHPARSAPEGEKVMQCFKSVREELQSGACSEAYSKHLECVQYYGWRESVSACKETRTEVQECAVRNGLGELKDS